MHRSSVELRRPGDLGGLRFRPMGSDERGLEELVELSLSRTSRLRTRHSDWATCCPSASKAAWRAACASDGTVSQSGPGMGGYGLMLEMLRDYCTNGSTRERLRIGMNPSEVPVVRFFPPTFEGPTPPAASAC